jgi:hypothetical protein
MGVPKVVRQNTEQWIVVSICPPAWVGAQQALDVWGQNSIHMLCLKISQYPAGHSLCNVLVVWCRRVYIEPSLSFESFRPLLCMLDSMAPGSVGETNHSTRFPIEFGRTMVAHLQLCVALQHWSCIPSLGIPSDFSRILDGYTCTGEPCQILIHSITTSSGDVEWMLLDVVPNAAHATVVPNSGGFAANARGGSLIQDIFGLIQANAVEHQDTNRCCSGRNRC